MIGPGGAECPSLAECMAGGCSSRCKNLDPTRWSKHPHAVDVVDDVDAARREYQRQDRAARWAERRLAGASFAQIAAPEPFSACGDCGACPACLAGALTDDDRAWLTERGWDGTMARPDQRAPVPDAAAAAHRRARGSIPDGLRAASGPPGRSTA